MDLVDRVDAWLALVARRTVLFGFGWARGRAKRLLKRPEKDPILDRAPEVGCEAGGMEGRIRLMSRHGLRFSFCLLWTMVASLLQAQTPNRSDVPAAMRSCLACHRSEVAEFLRHAMSRSLGEAGKATPGSVTNPDSGNLYEVVLKGSKAEVVTRFPSGGTLIQPIVGRIGAGIFDTSWVTAEIDPLTLAPSGRLFFAPVETLTGRGLALSPFELHPASAGPSFALTGACLECHTDTSPEALSQAGVNPGKDHLYPSNSLGANAFGELAAIGCEACHGDTRQHLRVMLGQVKPVKGVIGLKRLSQLPAAEQRDVCSRCHLQGDVRFTLNESADPETPLPGRLPVLVAATDPDDHRFVGQMERLVLSACFRASPEMTCNTCHLPHTGARAQGRASFDAACRKCHGSLPASAHKQGAGKLEGGCVECHMRRSQPFDLPHIQTSDHFIRRTVPPATTGLAHRSYADRDGKLKIFDDARSWPGLEGSPTSLPELFQSAVGGRWKAGVLAMGYVALGRPQDAASGFNQFPAPGTREARRPSAPAGLTSLETSPLFHHLRADFLEKTGHPQEALQAYSDCLMLEPKRAGARMSRARLRFQTGDLLGALEDTQVLIANHPQAEQPWDLRATIALGKQRLDLAAAALAKSTQLSPSNASAWHLLGKLRLKLGQVAQAKEALQRAYLLDPKREGLAADLEQASQ